MERGQVLGLHRTPSRRAVPESVSAVEVLVDRGIDGDHHQRPGSSRQVMLVEAEVLDELGLAPGQVREQIAVRGLHPLAAGDLLTIGDARLEVVKPRNPCSVMDTVRDGLRAELEGRAGWCARAVGAGRVAVGDAVVRGRVDDPEWLHAFRDALAAWEKDEPADPRPAFALARARCLTAAAAIEAQAAGSPAPAPVEPEPWAEDATIGDVYRPHDVAHTTLIEVARRHPSIARPHIEAVTESYRSELVGT